MNWAHVKYGGSRSTSRLSDERKADGRYWGRRCLQGGDQKGTFRLHYVSTNILCFAGLSLPIPVTVAAVNFVSLNAGVSTDSSCVRQSCHLYRTSDVEGKDRWYPRFVFDAQSLCCSVSNGRIISLTLVTVPEPLLPAARKERAAHRSLWGMALSTLVFNQ